MARLDGKLGIMLVGLALVGCLEPSGGRPRAAGDDQAPAREARMKKPRVLERDLATALALEPEELCNEAGGLSCIRQAHHLVLGGVDAYVKTVYEPAEEPSVPSTLAIERIVLAACAARIDRDLSSRREAVLATARIDPETYAARLFDRFLGREPTSAETHALATFGVELGERDRMVLACFAVGTSVEFLFY